MYIQNAKLPVTSRANRLKIVHHHQCGTGIQLSKSIQYCTTLSPFTQVVTHDINMQILLKVTEQFLEQNCKRESFKLV